MRESTSAQSNDPGNHEGEDEEFYGLLQYSCALPTPALSNSAGSVISRAVTVGDVEERRRILRSWLIPPDKDFDLHLLTKIFEGAEENPPHTWLLGLSRHAAVRLHDFSPRLADGPLPTGFPEALDWHRDGQDVPTPWIHYLRVQRARDDSSRRFTEETDCNDFLIRDSKLANSGRDGLKRGSLEELQLFLCEFLAQRRGAIFASHVSERIYNVWLPAGIITPGERENPGDLNKPFAVLPVVTVVRRPYRIDWRYALSTTTFLVPWRPGESELPSRSDLRPPRAMTAREMVHVITSTSGNSTYLRDHGRLTWTLEDSPLSSYLHKVTGDDRRDFCHSYAGPGNQGWGSQSLRHWIELLLMTVAETPRGREERDGDRLPEQQQVDDQILPDEVLRCLRVNGLWSAMMLTDTFPASTDLSQIADGRWWHEDALPTPEHIGELTAGMPRPLSAMFRLFADRNRGFAPTPSNRLDGLSYGGRSYATWLMPDENIMITAYSLTDDKFPSFSSLYQIGWFAYMAVGVTCAWQTMYSLTHDTDRLRDVAELSRLGHDRILDLETSTNSTSPGWPTPSSTGGCASCSALTASTRRSKSGSICCSGLRKRNSGPARSASALRKSTSAGKSSNLR